MAKKKIKLNFQEGSLNQSSAPKRFTGESVYTCVPSFWKLPLEHRGPEPSHSDTLPFLTLNPKGHSFVFAGSVRLLSFLICEDTEMLWASQYRYLRVMERDWFLMFHCPLKWNKDSSQHIGNLCDIIKMRTQWINQGQLLLPNKITILVILVL